MWVVVGDFTGLSWHFCGNVSKGSVCGEQWLFPRAEWEPRANLGFLLHSGWKAEGVSFSLLLPSHRVTGAGKGQMENCLQIYTVQELLLTGLLWTWDRAPTHPETGKIFRALG